MTYSAKRFIDNKKFFAVLLLMASALFIVALSWISVRLGVTGPAGEWIKGLTDLNGEANLPAWYTSTLWLLAANHTRKAGLLTRRLPAVQREATYWFALSAGFVFLSLDEVASIHENVGGILDSRAGNPDGLAPVYTWVWVAIAGAFVVFLGFLRFLTILPRTVSLALIGSAVVFLSGALGLETLGSLVEFGTIPNFPLGLNWEKVIALEEFLEMTGAILISLTVIIHRERTTAWFDS